MKLSQHSMSIIKKENIMFRKIYRALVLAYAADAANKTLAAISD